MASVDLPGRTGHERGDRARAQRKRYILDHRRGAVRPVTSGTVAGPRRQRSGSRGCSRTAVRFSSSVTCRCRAARSPVRRPPSRRRPEQAGCAERGTQEHERQQIPDHSMRGCNKVPVAAMSHRNVAGQWLPSGVFLPASVLLKSMYSSNRRRKLGDAAPGAVTG